MSYISTSPLSSKRFARILDLSGLQHRHDGLRCRGGFRAFWTSLDTTFVGAGAPTESLSQDKDRVDPIVAARVRMAFSDQWFGTLMLDAGGLDDSTTWQALATVGYRLNDRWAFQGGYRYLQAEWDTDFGEASLEFSGPILGVTYRF